MPHICNATLERLRQMDYHVFQTSMGCSMRHCLKILNKLINYNCASFESLTLFYAIKLALLI